MFEHAIAFQLATEPATAVVGDNDDGLTFEKELIYEGDFQTKELAFKVDAGVLDHWNTTHTQMVANGVEVPMPIQHTIDPEMRRATCLSMRRGLNSKGKQALFGKVKFRDKEAAKLAASSDVSVYVPPEKIDGKGTVYKYPIEHIAFTDYPVIPGLGKFTALAASLVNPVYKKKVFRMSLTSLAEKLGLPVADKDEPTIEAEIVTAVKALQTELETLKNAPKEGAKGPEPEAVAASLINLLRDNRAMKLSRMVEKGIILPTTKAEIEKQYCSDSALTLACSSKSGTADSFDATIAILEKNGPVIKLGEKTGAQGFAASLADPKQNPMLAEAERRKKEHDERQPARRY